MVKFDGCGEFTIPKIVGGKRLRRADLLIRVAAS
jgi:hypothetical protein